MAIQRTTKQQILDAINDLPGAEQLVPREARQEVTGLKLTIIDDRVATLVDEGAVIRKGRGVFVPAIQHPPARPISKTVMPDGMVKIENGDNVISLPPREDRTLATIQAGAALQLLGIDSEQHATQVAGDLRARVRRLEMGVHQPGSVTSAVLRAAASKDGAEGEA